MNVYLEKMRAHLEQHAQSRVRGLSTRDVVAKTYSEADLLKFAEALKTEALLPSAAFQLCSFIFERQEGRISNRIRREAADNVSDYVRTLRQGTDEGAVEVFVAWGAHRKDYKSICLQILDHPEAWIRKVALIYAGKFLLSGDLSILFKFQQDPYVSEIAMGGPLRFILRDQGLEVLKQLTKSPVLEDDCFENTSEGRVFHRSWTPFLKWFERQAK